VKNKKIVFKARFLKAGFIFITSLNTAYAVPLRFTHIAIAVEVEMDTM